MAPSEDEDVAPPKEEIVAPPEEEDDWPQWRRLGIYHLVSMILIVTFGSLVLVTTPSTPPPFEHKQMKLTSPRPLVIYPALPEEVRWWARTTKKPKGGFKYNFTTIYYWDSTTTKTTSTSTSTTSTSTTSTSTTSASTTSSSTTQTTTGTASFNNHSSTKPETVENVFVHKAAWDVSVAFSWVIGGGMVKITYPGMAWKRRHQHPVRSKFRTSQKAIEPSDTAEYPDTGYFKELMFTKTERKAVLCPLPNSNLTKPMLNAKGVFLHNTYWLCGGLEVVDSGEMEHTSWCYSMGERSTVESRSIKGWTPTLDLRVKLIGHSMAKHDGTFFIHNFDKLYHIKPNLQEFNSDNRFDVETIDFPFSISHACLVSIGDDKMALIGGMNATGPSDHMIIYDILSKTFREGPKLNIGRSNHACYVHYQAEDEMGSHFAKNMAGKTYIGVYGGMQHFHIMKSTEFLFSNDNEWQVGPDLFRQMMDTTAVFYHYNRGVVLSGGVGTSGGYVAVLLDKDEDGSLVWGQHHLVLSRTVMSPTGVIYEKPVLAYPASSIYGWPDRSLHMKSAYNPDLKMRFMSDRQVCTYQFIHQVQIMGNLAAYDYKKSNVYHKVYNLRPLLYILMKIYQRYIFDWRHQLDGRGELQFERKTIQKTGLLVYVRGAPENRLNFDIFGEEYVKMQQDVLLEEPTWELEEHIRNSCSFLQCDPPYGNTYPNLTQAYRPHQYHNMINASGLFQFLQTTLAQSRGPLDLWSYSMDFAHETPLGGNTIRKRKMFTTLFEVMPHEFQSFIVQYFTNKMYERFNDKTYQLSRKLIEQRHIWLLFRARRRAHPEQWGK